MNLEQYFMWRETLGENKQLKKRVKNLENANAKLKEASKNMNALCYIEANLTPDCNPYYCVRKLKFEIKELKARIKDLEEQK